MVRSMVLLFLACGTVLAAEPPQTCTPADRLPACREDAAACLEALQHSPKGDPVQLACSAEAACLAGRAGACGAFLQFVADERFSRDLTAHSAAFEAACAEGQKGACSVVAPLLDRRLAKAAPAEAAELRVRADRATAKSCALGMGCKAVVARLAQDASSAAADEGAVTALEAACKGGGDAVACAWLAKAFGDLESTAGRQAGCKSGIARACVAEADARKRAGSDADAWWAAACALGDCRSCNLRLRDDKGRLTVAADHAHAVTARTTCDKACSVGRMASCNLAHDLHVAGIGGLRDEAGAVSRRLALCQVDPAACVALASAWLVAGDQAVDADVSRRLGQVCSSHSDFRVRQPACSASADRSSVRADRSSCSTGDDAACTRVGRRLRDLGLHAQAADALATACDHGRGEACAALADVRERGLDLPPLAADTAGKLKAAARKACDSGDGVACFELAQTESLGSPAARKAMQVLSATCTKSGGAACRLAADLCQGYGRKLPEDPRKAMTLRERGCGAGDAKACLAAAVQADEDSEDATSGERSCALYLRSCRLGDADGCVHLQRARPAPAGAAEVLAAACKAGILDVCGP